MAATLPTRLRAVAAVERAGVGRVERNCWIGSVKLFGSTFCFNDFP